MASTMQADTKISNDLVVLKEKMNLLDSMLIQHPGVSETKPSVATSEAVRSVVGYLDACGPRMIELVTACMSRENVLSEDVLGDVLGCNDRLQKLLSDVDTLLLTEAEPRASTTEASPAAAAATTSAAADLTNQFDDLLLGDDTGDLFGGDEPAAAAVPSIAGAKTTGETSEGFLDLFGDDEPAVAAPAVPSIAGAKTTGETSEDFLDEKPAAVANPSAAEATTKDPFDDFFNERSGESNFLE